ncbi:transposase family protein [Kribbella sp. NPDC003557]|uniref:transposase family protein n=1 Tax=Kribbella sp. NPDC003557 TaxID=3154449 RepID=UPI0033AD43B6
MPTGNRAHSKHNYSSKRLRQGLNIHAYIGTTATVPSKRNKYHDLTGYEETVDRTISSRRSAVERAIGHLKNWKILTGGSAADSPNYPISSAPPAALSSTASDGDF